MYFSCNQNTFSTSDEQHCEDSGGFKALERLANPNLQDSRSLSSYVVVARKVRGDVGDLSMKSANLIFNLRHLAH